jgi:hypothetical protein
MKHQIKNLFILTSLLNVLLLLSCKNSVTVKTPQRTDFTYLQVMENLSSHELAEKEIENMWRLDAIENSARAAYTYPEFLNEITFFDENNTEKSFLDLDNNEKARFTEAWKKFRSKEIENKLEEDPVFRELLLVDLAAFEETYSTASRSALKNYENFMSKYFENIDKYSSLNEPESTSRKANKKDPIKKDSGVLESMNALRNCFQKYEEEEDPQGSGLILITPDNSSNGRGGKGHAALIKTGKWNDDFQKNALLKLSITSSPLGKGGQWEGKIDGVQDEPVGYWAGNAGSSAKTVSVYYVKKQNLVYDDGELNEQNSVDDRASLEECLKAVECAKKYYGKNYSLFHGHDSTEKGIYCSQLVYLAWKGVSKDYILENEGWWVTPKELAKSSKIKVINTYVNK